MTYAIYLHRTDVKSKSYYHYSVFSFVLRHDDSICSDVCDIPHTFDIHVLMSFPVQSIVHKGHK